MLQIFQPSVNNIKSSIFDGGQFEIKSKWPLEVAFRLLFIWKCSTCSSKPWTCNVGQDTTLVLLVEPHSLIFDKSSIFIDSHFKKINNKSTESKTSPLDLGTFKMYILTQVCLYRSITSKVIYFYCIFGSGHLGKTTKVVMKTSQKLLLAKLCSHCISGPCKYWFRHQICLSDD